MTEYPLNPLLLSRDLLEALRALRWAFGDDVAADLEDAVYAALQDAANEERIVGVGWDGEPIYVGGSRQAHEDVPF